jgi:hypothetical protein
MDEDRRRFEKDWSRWMSEPVEPQLRFRVIPAIWCRERLPNGLSKQEAIEHARSRAVERRFTYVLVWNRGEEVWLYPTGETYERRMSVGEVAGPYTWLRGRRQRGFIFE